ncbi:MAG: LarC family nickel insertion protein [Pseudomonadota bacterium]
MSQTILIKPLGGIAGDMFAGACGGLWPHLQGVVVDDVRAAGLPDGVDIRFDSVHVNGFAATHFHVGGEGGAVTPSGGYERIVSILSESALDASVKSVSLEILKLLGDAEGHVHGKPLESVHFHELAGWDSLADTVAAASFITRSDVSDWRVGAIPLGGGTVNTAHGIITCPAPAVLRLLAGYALRDDGVTGERVTPTGAAILRYLCAPEAAAVSGRLVSDAMGAGTRRFSAMANVVQLLAFETETTDHGVDRVTEIEFDIDDMTPEEIAVSTDRLRDHPGVLDVTQTAQMGKKGRAMFLIRVLCRPEVSGAVQQACLVETSTLGVRFADLSRRTLDRRSFEAEGMRVKTAARPGGRTAKAESDDVASGATLGDRRAAARLAETRALEELGDG